MGELYKQDLDRLQIRHLKESFKLFGTDALFFETTTELKNIYTDTEVTSVENGLKVAILFQTYPQNRRTLEKVGWYDKDKEDQPTLAWVPLDLSILERWQKVLIPGRNSAYTTQTLWRPYQVTKLATTMDHPSYYIVALVPLFTDDAPDIDREDNSNFIDFGSIPDL